MKIFLGSSAYLMSIRHKIGEMVNQHSNRWLSKGVDVRLLIWEDYTSAYNGSSKQEEYINDLVLPSTYAVFLADKKIRPFTRKELDAKKAQDKRSILCYLLPFGRKKKKYNDELYNSLTNEGLAVEKACDLDDVCKRLEHVIDDYAARNGGTTGGGIGMMTKMFYTTLSDDKSAYLPKIGTTIRRLDDFSKDNFGIHCVLHPTGNRELLFKETDHYFPIFSVNASVENVEELDSAMKVQVDEASRLDYITLFDASGDLYKNNPDVRRLLEGKDFFPTRFESVNDVFVELLSWLQKEKKRLLANLSIEVRDGQIAVNGKEAMTVAGADPTGRLDVAVSAKEKLDEEIEKNVTTKPADSNIIGLVSQRNIHQDYIQGFINSRLNTWAARPIRKDNWQENEERKIAKIDAIVEEKMSGDVSVETAWQVVGLLKNKEELVRQLVEKEYNYPHRLLSVQMHAIGVFDTYIDKVEQPKEEDELYDRLLADAKRFQLKDPIVEMIRMNYANSFARIEKKAQAQQLYKEAINNLEGMKDGSVIVNRYITIVYVHLIHLLLEAENRQETNRKIDKLRDHVGNVDTENVVYLVDKCMLAAVEVTAISIKDETQYDKVEAAQVVYERTKELLKMTADSHEYGDVFVYLPNAIARYYIDHLKYQKREAVESYAKTAIRYLDDCIENCVNLYKRNYSDGLFHMGEFYHQRGFLYAKFPQMVINGLSDYQRALELRKLYFDLSKDPSSECRIAQTLVNIGALELELTSFAEISAKDKMKILKIALERAVYAVKIYGNHMGNDDLAEELHYYEALLLQGTVEYAISQETGAVLYYNYAIDHLFACWRWNVDNPDNEYSETFDANAGRILRKHKFI